MNALTPEEQALLKDKLQILAEDMSAQINSLKNDNDVNWDCYDVGNWESNLKSVLAIANELKIELDIEFEDVY